MTHAVILLIIVSRMKARTTRLQGFTLVELLIVIVIIAILAAITVVAYNGIQQRARDSSRSSAVASIMKSLELYYIDKGEFPSSQGSSSPISAVWLSTADSSWNQLETALKPYVSTVPKDPVSSPGKDVGSSGADIYNFNYYSNPTGYYCNAGANQMYLLVYRLEGGPQKRVVNGNCDTGHPLGYSLLDSGYLVVK